MKAARFSAVFLVMMSNLLLELLLTRIFSATMWYHFAFMAVSVALFGTTLGAVIVHLWPRRFAGADPWRVAARAALLYAGSIIVCAVLQLRLNVTFGATWAELTTLAALYVVIAVPFTLSGIFICVALLQAGDDVGGVYCADLLGAGFGCALFVPFMAYGDGPRAVLLLGALAALGAALTAWQASDRRTVLAAILAAGLCGLAFGAHLDRRALAVHWAKGGWDRDHVFEKWNAFSRLLVDPMPSLPFGWGLSSNLRNRHAPVAQKGLSIDGAAATVLTAFDGDLSKLEYPQWDVTALAHVVRPGGAVLVIGVGGGRDILTALTFGPRRVVGAEVNGGILDLLDGPFADFTGHLRQWPGVELVHDEARSYVARSREHFDVIQASLVDTWAAAANGAYVLSENALYTEEAFQIFLAHLTTDGIFSISRWYFEPEPGETLRLVSLASAALRRRGSAGRRTSCSWRTAAAPCRWPRCSVAARPFTAGEVGALTSVVRRQGFRGAARPDESPTRHPRTTCGAAEARAAIDAFPLDLQPPDRRSPVLLQHAAPARRLRAPSASSRMSLPPTPTRWWPWCGSSSWSWCCRLVFIVLPLWWRAPAEVARRRRRRVSCISSASVWDSS